MCVCVCVYCFEVDDADGGGKLRGTLWMQLLILRAKHRSQHWTTSIIATTAAAAEHNWVLRSTGRSNSRQATWQHTHTKPTVAHSALETRTHLHWPGNVNTLKCEQTHTHTYIYYIGWERWGGPPCAPFAHIAHFRVFQMPGSHSIHTSNDWTKNDTWTCPQNLALAWDGTHQQNSWMGKQIIRKNNGKPLNNSNDCYTGLEQNNKQEMRQGAGTRDVKVLGVFSPLGHESGSERWWWSV